MGKTIAVIVIILLSLGCGALGWEVMRQQADKQALDAKIDELSGQLALLRAEKQAKPDTAKYVTQDMLDDLHARMTSIENQNKELIASQQEMTAKLKDAGASGGSGSGSPVDLGNLDDKQKEALRELVQKEGQARDMQRANMIKSMVKQRFDAEFKKISDKLELTPMQKDDAAKLMDGMIEKGFGAILKAFESGDLEAAREQLRLLVEDSDGEIKKILDPDQIEKLKELDPDGFGRREADRQRRGQ